jgi:hypothetical protein
MCLGEESEIADSVRLSPARFFGIRARYEAGDRGAVMATGAWWYHDARDTG